MRKILIQIVFLVCAFISNAQTPVTFTLLTAPCDTDGVLVASYTGSAPFNVEWYLLDTYFTKTVTVTATTDTLKHYRGGPVVMRITNGVGRVFSYGSYLGAAPFSIALSSTPIVGTANRTVAAAITGGVPPYSYCWYSNVHKIKPCLGTADTISVPPGIYGVAVTDAAGCGFSSGWEANYDTVRYPTGILENTPSSDNRSFKLFPNPTKDFLSVQVYKNVDNSVEMTITDPVGRIMDFQHIILIHGEEIVPVNLSRYSNGIYFVSITQLGFTQTRKFVLQR